MYLIPVDVVRRNSVDVLDVLGKRPVQSRVITGAAIDDEIRTPQTRAA